MGFFNQKDDECIKIMIGSKFKVGKTYLASEISNLPGYGPMILFDTHKGSNWVRGKMSPGSEILRVTSNIGLQKAIDMLLMAQRKGESTFNTLVIDTISDVWRRAMAAYDEKLLAEIEVTSDADELDIGKIPLGAWGTIKGAYNRIINKALVLDMNIILLGWEGDVFGRKGPTGETRTKASKDTEALIDASLNMYIDKTGQRRFRVYYDRTGFLKDKMIADADVFARLREELKKSVPESVTTPVEEISKKEKKEKKEDKMGICSSCGEEAPVKMLEVSEERVCFKCLVDKK